MKIVLFKRKILTLLACAAAAALMFYVVNYPSVAGVYAADPRWLKKEFGGNGEYLLDHA